MSNMTGTVSYTCWGMNTVQKVPYQKEILITFQVVGKLWQVRYTFQKIITEFLTEFQRSCH